MESDNFYCILQLNLSTEEIEKELQGMEHLVDTEGQAIMALNLHVRYIDTRLVKLCEGHILGGKRGPACEKKHIQHQ